MRVASSFVSIEQAKLNLAEVAGKDVDAVATLFPLLNFLCPEINAEMTEGLVHCYEECGWLPEWSSPGFRHCMIGNNSATPYVARFTLNGIHIVTKTHVL